MENHIGVGEGMTYCKKHKCWWQKGEFCEKCKIEQVARNVEIENKCWEEKRKSIYKPLPVTLTKRG